MNDEIPDEELIGGYLFCFGIGLISGGIVGFIIGILI